jgi:serine/threonine-protein kinase
VVDSRYRLSQPLLTDSDTPVFLGTHLHLGRTVEVKFLLDSSKKSQRRFFREGRILSLLRHPNIVAVHDMGTWGERAYLVVEHLDGSGLGDRLQPGEPVSTSAFLAVARPLLAALACAHDRGVIHRNLSAESVRIVTSPTEGESIKLTGFGASRRMGDFSSSVTRSSPLIEASAHYAPEQLVGVDSEDARTDIYAAGVLFYRLLTGIPPFQARTIADLVGKVLGEPPRPPSDHRPDISSALDAIVLRCLEKQPETRFPDARSLAAAIEGELADITPSDRDTLPPTA